MESSKAERCFDSHVNESCRTTRLAWTRLASPAEKHTIVGCGHCDKHHVARARFPIPPAASFRPPDVVLSAATRQLLHLDVVLSAATRRARGRRQRMPATGCDRNGAATNRGREIDAAKRELSCPASPLHEAEVAARMSAPPPVAVMSCRSAGTSTGFAPS